MNPVLDREQLERAAFFSPCQSKVHLGTWIRYYLGLDLPDGMVCDDDTRNDPTNSSPLDLVWEIYSKALQGDDPDFGRVLAFAARDSAKTLAMSVLETISLFHLRRSVGHLAAIESQANKAAGYCEKFLQRPILKDFVIGNNKRTLEVCWYETHDKKKFFTPKEYSNAQKAGEKWIDGLDRKSYKIEIVIATMSGANCVDPKAPIAMADGTYKPARDVQVGDWVTCFNTQTVEMEKVEVTQKNSGRKPSMVITTASGRQLLLSEDHRVFTQKGWIHARNLKLKDRLITISGSPYCTSGQSYEAVFVKDPNQIILGSLLGDASLSWPKKNTGKRYGAGPRLKFSHCASQLSYVMHKTEIATQAGCIFSCFTKTGNQYAATSRIASNLVDISNLLYPMGVKTVTREYLDLLSDEGVAYWLMDDGSGSAEKIGARKDRNISVATCSFSMAEHRVIVDWFKERYSVQPTIEEVSNQTGKKWPVLWFDLEDSRKLSAILDPYVHPCVKYKFTTPVKLTARYCIECDAPNTKAARKGFSGCTLHDRIKGNGQHRRKIHQTKIKNRYSDSIAKLEFVGLKDVIDIGTDPSRPEVQNFFACGINVHNSLHVPLLCLDECELIPAKPFAEAMMIPSQGENGELPIVFMTSSRKFARGPVQKMIDEAKETGTKVRHWNYLDVTESCPPERHLPDKPKSTIYINEDTLRAIPQNEYDLLSEKEQAPWLKEEGYEGCLSQCSLFSVCRGRLATKQKSKAKMLKKISLTANQFKVFANDTDTAKAQLLCWKPQSGALIFRRLNKKRHVKPAWEIAELATGNPHPHIRTKQQLFQLFKSLDAKIVAGMDFGFTHNFAVLIAAIYGNKCYIFHAFELQGLDINEKLTVCETMLRPYDPIIHPDNAYPSDIKSFRKAGYTLTNFKKDIQLGIDAGRSKITPADDVEPELVFLDDSNEESLVVTAFKKISGYEYILDANGNPTDQPKEEDDDTSAAFRYLCQQEFGKHLGKSHKPPDPKAQPKATSNPNHNWMAQEIQQQMQANDGGNEGVTIRRGKFFVST